MKRFAYLAGLPRTGSTLLGTLLSEHPDLYTTRTSCISYLMNTALRFNLGESPYFDLNDPHSECWGIAKGILYGAYEQVSEPVIIEKDRTWVKMIPTLRRITGEEPRIIAPVRSIPEIIASFVIISNKIGKNSKIFEEIADANRDVNPWTVSRIIWEKYIYLDWRNFKAAYENDPDCFLLLDYNDLVADPNSSLEKLTDFLKISKISPKTSGLVNPHPENDSVYGMPGLHDIASELKRTSPPAWEILGDDCYEFWRSRKLEFWLPG